MAEPKTRYKVLTRGSWPEPRRIASVLRRETVGGMLLIGAALVALIWANTPWADAYSALRDFHIGPSSLHLNLSLSEWATDGLLAIFFFVVGLELKHEVVAGDLRDPRRAALPVVAAVGGMAVPAIIYVLVNRGGPEGVLDGWAIPTATDIAFALAVLAVINTHLPTALRTFLLTLAVVDDLLAVTVIAVFYTSKLDLPYLALARVPIALFALAVQRRISSPWLLVPLALIAWWLVHLSGVHATVAGVLLGFTVPVLVRKGEDAEHGPAERFEHHIRPLSAGFAVPVFAFFAAGVTVGGLGGLTDVNYGLKPLQVPTTEPTSRFQRPDRFVGCPAQSSVGARVCQLGASNALALAAAPSLLPLAGRAPTHARILAHDRMARCRFGPHRVGKRSPPAGHLGQEPAQHRRR